MKEISGAAHLEAARTRKMVEPAYVHVVMELIDGEENIPR
jgi:hypothetical protein